MTEKEDIPKFAIVGHPNKGKSSIVSTLTQDSQIPIGSMPGTTTKTSSFSINVSGETLFEIYDTPGFQQPRKVLKWLKEHEQGADSRSYVVRQFALQEKHLEIYPDEVHLLKPIVAGAGIIYVVDASVPYGPEYQSELEILRWSGRPRMALINSTGESKYLDSWKTTLNQFFNVVKVFNAQHSEFDKQIELLMAFSHIDESWKSNLTKAANSLKVDRENKISAATNLLSEMIAEMFNLKITKSLASKEGQEKQVAQSESELRLKLVEMEKKYRSQVESIFRHTNITLEEENTYLNQEPELFSKESSQLFGLNKTELLKYGALTGAGLGGAFDVATGGASLLMGSLVGGAIGAGTMFFAANTLAQVKVISVPLGKDILEVGPIKDPSFAYMVLERARAHLAYTAKRNHAIREQKSLSEMMSIAQPLEENEKKSLIKELSKLQKDRGNLKAFDNISSTLKKSLSSPAA